MVIVNILENTPSWVWVLFGVLIWRGRSLLKDNPVSLKKVLVLPIIFTIWGIDRVWVAFSYRTLTFSLYIASLCIGASVAYFLYRRKKYYQKDGIVFQQGSWIPLAIMIGNFVVKYALNICMAAQPGVYQSFGFNVIYGVISGLSVGLFFGGTAKTLFSTLKIKRGLVT